MTIRRMLISAVVVVVGALVVLCLTVAGFIYTRNRTNGSVVSSGTTREYLLYVPRSYERSRPMPLVISLHAAAQWPAAQMATSRWNQVAEEQGFLVVYPAGGFGALVKAWPVDREAGRRAEVRFISDLIDALEKAYNIDPTRIYVNGFSNGGAMAFVASCALSDRIAAVGTVAAAQSVPWTWCTAARPMPLIAFHGTADPVVPYNGGGSWASRRPFPSVPAWAANWARRNACDITPTASVVVAADVTRLEYTHCADDASVVLYTIKEGGHGWPGGEPMPRWLVGRTSDGIDATRRMWAFFREHRLPGSGRAR